MAASTTIEYDHRPLVSYAPNSQQSSILKYPQSLPFLRTATEDLSRTIELRVYQLSCRALQTVFSLPLCKHKTHQITIRIWLLR